MITSLLLSVVFNVTALSFDCASISIGLFVMIVNYDRVKKLEEKMAKVCRFFETRDEMNAWMHLQDPRYSPMTLLARDISDELQLMLLEESR